MLSAYIAQRFGSFLIILMIFGARVDLKLFFSIKMGFFLLVQVQGGKRGRETAAGGDRIQCNPLLPDPSPLTTSSLPAMPLPAHFCPSQSQFPPLLPFLLAYLLQQEVGELMAGAGRIWPSQQHPGSVLFSVPIKSVCSQKALYSAFAAVAINGMFGETNRIGV